MAKRGENRYRIAADNRKARFNYEIGQTFEAGIALTGTEVKSLRGGKATIGESYAGEMGGRSISSTPISPNTSRPTASITRRAARANCCCTSARWNRLLGAVQREGMTVVPLKVYFNERGRAKVEVALAKGKKLHDKRESERARDWQREQGRLMREKG